MPKESGVTSSSSIFCTPRSRMLACTAAPSATTSSGFSSVCGLRSKYSCTVRRISGVRVVPPTSTTSSICLGSNCASASACRTGAMVRSTTGRISASKAQRHLFHFGELVLQGDQFLAEFLRQLAVRRKIDLIVLQNLLVDERLKQVIDIVAAQVCIAVGRKHLEDVAFAGGDQFQHGNIEC